MVLSEDLQKQLAKKFEPSTMVEMKFKGYDLSFKTDEEGNAILLFMGKKTGQGTIKGERYARTLKKDREGKIFKDHWELKGKAS
ncbi:MAG: hypothetical protein JWQ40_2531 [Segetibacter sp.]|nr:hypothetical protein [Segetibacter sp.]